MDSSSEEVDLRLKRIDELSEAELLAIAYERGLNPGEKKRQREYTPRAKWVTFDEAKREEFLRELANCGNIAYACRKVGAKVATLSNYRRENPEFNDHIDDAVAHYAAIVVGAAHERAVDGYLVPIVGGRNKDEIVTYERRFSDSIMSMMLKKVDPAFNPTQKVEVSGTPGGLVDPSEMNFRKLSRRAKRVLRVLLTVLKEDDQMRAQGIDPNSVLKNPSPPGVLAPLEVNAIEVHSTEAIDEEDDEAEEP